MLKKMMAFLLAAVMVLPLAACQKGGENSGEKFSADLAAYYDTLFQGGEDEPAMVELEDDLLDNAYPGLSEVERKQTVAYDAMISSIPCAVAMVEVSNSDDVETVKNIFQTRIDTMVGTDDEPGMAWYPDTIEGWKNDSEIVVKGNYVCLFVGEKKDDMVAGFNALGEQ